MYIKSLKYIFIPIILSLVIFYLSCLIPVGELPEIEVEFFMPLDKIVHFLMYFGLSAATGLYYVYGKKGNVNFLKLTIGALLLPILYGGFIEILQTFYFPPRTGDWLDFVADILGSLSSLPIILYYRKKILRYR